MASFPVSLCVTELNRGSIHKNSLLVFWEKYSQEYINQGNLCVSQKHSYYMNSGRINSMSFTYISACANIPIILSEHLTVGFKHYSIKSSGPLHLSSPYMNLFLILINTSFPSFFHYGSYTKANSKCKRKISSNWRSVFRYRLENHKSFPIVPYSLCTTFVLEYLTSPVFKFLQYPNIWLLQSISFFSKDIKVDVINDFSSLNFNSKLSKNQQQQW